MSRRSRRVRASISAYVRPIVGGQQVACRTRDVSEAGLCLDTIAQLDEGTRVTLTVQNPTNGGMIDVAGQVVRSVDSPAPSVAIALTSPPPEWSYIVDHLAKVTPPPLRKPRRLRILVVGDEQRQRGAMALYLTSGWDVLFAQDEDAATDALSDAKVDAVIAETEPSDPTWRTLMAKVRQEQPQAKRIVRTTKALRDESGAVHRFVERDAGIEALLDAVATTTAMA